MVKPASPAQSPILWMPALPLSRSMEHLGRLPSKVTCRQPGSLSAFQTAHREILQVLRVQPREYPAKGFATRVPWRKVKKVRSQASLAVPKSALHPAVLRLAVLPPPRMPARITIPSISSRRCRPPRGDRDSSPEFKCFRHPGFIFGLRVGVCGQHLLTPGPHLIEIKKAFRPCFCPGLLHGDGKQPVE